MKSKISTIVLIIGCFLGLCLLLYPTVSDFWNSHYATRAIATYNKKVESISKSDYTNLFNLATEYNSELLKRHYPFAISDNEKKQYEKCLNIMGDGMMGYIEIEKINVNLPIYHGTSDKVLNTSIGHIDWSSLPIGGESSHCVLSGHRGLVNAKIFTDLDVLREGDTFKLNILGKTLTYEIDRILTVNPDDTNELQIEKGKDLCTLVTCTPYGINTQRLLVRGHRIANKETAENVIAEAVVIDKYMVTMCIAVPLLAVLFFAVMFRKPKRRNRFD